MRLLESTGKLKILNLAVFFSSSSMIYRLFHPTGGPVGYLFYFFGLGGAAGAGNGLGTARGATAARGATTARGATAGRGARGGRGIRTSRTDRMASLVILRSSASLGTSFMASSTSALISISVGIFIKPDIASECLLICSDSFSFC